MNALTERQVHDLAVALHTAQVDKAGRPYIEHLEREGRGALPDRQQGWHGLEKALRPTATNGKTWIGGKIGRITGRIRISCYYS
jgi:hypothetical protein